MPALYDLKRHKCSFLRVKMKYEKPIEGLAFLLLIYIFTVEDPL